MSGGGPSPEVFQLLQAGNVRKLWGCPPVKLRPFLPYLVRMALSPIALSSHSQNDARVRDRKLVLSLIAGNGSFCNQILSYSSYIVPFG